VRDYEHGLGAPAVYHLCEGCEALFQWPRPGRDELLACYPRDYRPYESAGLVATLKGVQARLLAGKLAPLLGPRSGRILELGPGAGFFLRELARRGYRDLTAVDWSGELAGVIEATGARFVAGDIEHVDLGGGFSRVVLNNVIEHAIDPLALLERLARALHRDGRVVLTTPNAASLGRGVFGPFWSGLHAPRHVHVFSRASLVALAARAGMEVERFEALPDPASWAVSLQNWARRAQTAPALRAGSGTSLYTLASLPACTVPALAETALGRGASILATLRAR
jgi:SAM-dependent methyltransferase